MPAASRSPLSLVECTSTTFVSRPENCSERSGDVDARAGARIVGRVGHRLVGDELRLHDEPCCTVERLDLVEHAATARCANDTSRTEETRTVRPAGERHSTRRRSTPARKSRVRSWRAALSEADVEGLVVDEQPDDLAVGDVHHRLAGLGVAVAGLGVGQRARLVEAVQVGAGEAVRLALVEVAAQADVTVGEREHRSRLGDHVQVQLGLAAAPTARR